MWFPDAFVGTMAQLLVAVENGTEPEIRGRDNVETIALCEAVFAAATRASRRHRARVPGMTPDLRIQQAIVVADARGARVTARTDEFDEPEAERIAVLFGRRPAGTTCPLAHFACPFGKIRVAVVRGGGPAGPGDVIAFRFLVLDRELYRHLGDPFAISDRYPVDWQVSGPLQILEWPAERLPERTLEELDSVLKAGDSGLLLGGAQALVDGNRVLVPRSAPDEALARGVWKLLPDRTRSDLWPASFAFSDELGLHFAVLPACRREPLAPGC